MTPRGQTIASRASCQLRFHFLGRRIARGALCRSCGTSLVASFHPSTSGVLAEFRLEAPPRSSPRVCSTIPCGTEEPASFDKQPSPYDEGPRLASKLHRALWRAFSAKRKPSCRLGMPAAIDWHLFNPVEAGDFDESFAFGTRS